MSYTSPMTGPHLEAVAPALKPPGDSSHPIPLIVKALDQQETLEIQRARYHVFVTEMKGPYLDNFALHQGQVLIDEFDHCSHHFYFRNPIHQQVGGAIQLCLEADNPQGLFEDYDQQQSYCRRLGTHIPKELTIGASWTSKLFVEPEDRSRLVGKFEHKYLMSQLLIFRAFEYAMSQKVKTNWIQCHPKDERYYIRFGYKTFARNLLHPNMDQSSSEAERLLMVLDFNDRAHLIKVRSPLIHILKNYSK